MFKWTDRLAEMHLLLLCTFRCDLGTRFEVMAGAAPSAMDAGSYLFSFARSTSQILAAL